MFTYSCMSACMYTCMYVCLCAVMCVCVDIAVTGIAEEFNTVDGGNIAPLSVEGYVPSRSQYVCTYVRMDVRIYICVYVCNACNACGVCM